MVNYEKIFEPYYEGGWEAYPLETTLVTAGALNAYDAALMHIEDYLDTEVDPNDNLAETYDDTATYEVGDYCIYNGVLYKCITAIDEAEEFDLEKWDHVLVTDEMGHGGGGSSVSITPTLSTGTKIADFEIDGQTGELYAPTGGGNANIWTGTQAEYEAQASQIADGTLVNITDDEQEVVEGGTIYSTDEQVIGLWTDNRPLYQKTIDCGTMPNTTQKFISTGFASGTIDVKNLYGYSYNPTNDITLALPRPSYSSTDSVDVIVVQNDGYESIRISTATNYSSFTDTKITIEYTKTTDAPLDAVVGKKTMYIASSDCYSTEEKEVGCAPNGKPLYQKTILHTGTFTGSESLQTISHGISNFDEAVSINGFIYDAHESSPSWMPLPRFYTSNAFGISHLTTTDIYIYIPSAFGTRLRNARITIQYTKTTDTAGSGSYTPASGKAVHYSTDEQVIGTWIDGSTIYCKTIDLESDTNIAHNQWTATGKSITGIDKIIECSSTNSGGTYYPLMAYHASGSSEIQLLACRDNANANSRYVTIKYTKSV